MGMDLTDVMTYLQEWYETHRAVPACRLYYFRSRKLFRIPTVKSKLLPCNPMFLSYKTQTLQIVTIFQNMKSWFVLQFRELYLPGTWACKWGDWPRTCQWTWPPVYQSDLGRATNQYFSIALTSKISSKISINNERFRLAKITGKFLLECNFPVEGYFRPAVVFRVQKNESALGLESTVQEMWAVSFSETP